MRPVGPGPRLVEPERAEDPPHLWVEIAVVERHLLARTLGKQRRDLRKLAHHEVSVNPSRAGFARNAAKCGSLHLPFATDNVSNGRWTVTRGYVVPGFGCPDFVGRLGLRSPDGWPLKLMKNSSASSAAAPASDAIAMMI